MRNTISVKPELIRWAIKRSGLAFADLAANVPHLADWQSGKKEPTLRQLEDFAKRTTTPLGYFFLSVPPVEKLAIPDFRTMDDSVPERPSPNLLDTLYDMQRRQHWMRDYLIEQGHEELPFVGSARMSRPIESVAVSIREALGLDGDWAEQCRSWEDALRKLRAAIEDIEIMVAASGVVGLNNTRALDPDEFRGFVLSDRHAPLIFVNAADSKSAQMFTLAHELAHVWVGKDGVFNLINTMPASDEVEEFCNHVAAEFLVPADNFRTHWPGVKDATNPFKKLAGSFKVSPIVVARRALDMDLIDRARFYAFYAQNQLEWRKNKETKESSGGNFYATQNIRLGRRFSLAVVQAAREGKLLYRDAYQLTGLRGKTFERYAAQVIQPSKV
ncbi:MAG TPA: ImmA/IrrE family metallo-endopeptidase [Gemmataceae bacterium]|nr:ImmA/IrrE family metallo-endopeptidase [Gemmataceae bacterium]